MATKFKLTNSAQLKIAYFIVGAAIGLAFLAAALGWAALPGFTIIASIGIGLLALGMIAILIRSVFIKIKNNDKDLLTKIMLKDDNDDSYFENWATIKSIILFPSFLGALFFFFCNRMISGMLFLSFTAAISLIAVGLLTQASLLLPMGFFMLSVLILFTAIGGAAFRVFAGKYVKPSNNNSKEDYVDNIEDRAGQPQLKAKSPVAFASTIIAVAAPTLAGVSLLKSAIFFANPVSTIITISVISSLMLITLLGISIFNGSGGEKVKDKNNDLLTLPIGINNLTPTSSVWDFSFLKNIPLKRVKMGNENVVVNNAIKELN